VRRAPRGVARQPLGPRAPGLKVGPGERGKIFAFLGATTIGVKAGATREVADEWLDRYPDDASVMAYIGRSGWNDLALGGAIPDEELVEAVEESYRLVVSRLPKRDRPDGWEAVSGGGASS
jgi:predicted DNA-binding protein (MmcQ/YjbR family)